VLTTSTSSYHVRSLEMILHLDYVLICVRESVQALDLFMH
jgi:hypothetical protein